MKTNIVIFGPQFAGKTTLAKELQHQIGNAEIVSFATPLKVMAGRLRGKDYINDRQAKMEDREYLQYLGQAVREIVPDFWIRAALKQMEKVNLQGKTTITDDGRFQNELNAAKETGAFTIYIFVPRGTRAMRGSLAGEDEISERDLDDVAPEEYDMYLTDSPFLLDEKSGKLVPNTVVFYKIMKEYDHKRILNEVKSESAQTHSN